VSDLRRPIGGEVMAGLDIGSVVVNYVRSTKQDKDAPVDEGALISGMKEPIAGGERQEDPPRSTTTISVSESELDVHRDVTEPWRRGPSFSSVASLGMLSRARPLEREFGLRVGMSWLPRLLQTYFSRDLHIGALERDDGLSIRLTTGEGGLDPARASAMMADVSAFLAAFVSSGERRISDLM
jgi:hypothetical protein